MKLSLYTGVKVNEGYSRDGTFEAITQVEFTRDGFELLRLLSAPDGAKRTIAGPQAGIIL